MTAKTFFFPGSNFREWRINRVRERIAGNKKRLEARVAFLRPGASSYDYDVTLIACVAHKIGRDQQLLARLQGFAQNHDGELRQPVKIQKKETQ